MNKGDVQRARKRASATLEAIDYDFSQFTMENFRDWLQRRRGRGIEFVPWAMPPALFGVWLSSNGRDFVFYEKDTPPIHQAHIQLHEMAHMLCDHSTLEVDSQQASVFFRQAVADPAAPAEPLLCSAHSEEAELEAEVLAALIQERVLHSSGLQELAKVVSSDGDFATQFGAFVDTLKSYT